MIPPISLASGLFSQRPLAAAGSDPAGINSVADRGVDGGRTGGSINFQDVLLKSLDQVNELDRQSQGIIAGALTGEDYTQAEVFTAVKKADLAFRTMLQIRNKLLDAYNELKNVRM